jgi:putative ABC transport system permease protein
VIALITLLVLFIAALGEGLGNGNREYISKLDGELIVYQAKVDNLIAASRLSRDRLAAIKRVDGVADAGLLGTSSATLVLPADVEPLKVAILGVEPGHIGEPLVLEGQQLSTGLADEVLIDSKTAYRSGLAAGDSLTLRTTQGTRDEFYTLRIVGVTDSQQYALQPTVFLPFNTWDRVRPKSEAEVNNPNPVANVILVKLSDPERVSETRERIQSQVSNVEAATLKEASRPCPGTQRSKAP